MNLADDIYPDKALLQYSQICALPDPEAFNMRTLRRWLVDPLCANWKVRDYNDAVMTTWGALNNHPYDKDKSLWSQFRSVIWGLIWMKRPPKTIYDADLALAQPKAQVDGLTHWWASELIPFVKALKEWRWNERTPDVEESSDNSSNNSSDSETRSVDSVAPFASEVKKEKTLESWSEDSALRLTSGISTVVACLLPVIAISVLSQLEGLRNLLICLAGFSLLFAVGLIALTQGTSKRTEVFAATAA